MKKTIKTLLLFSVLALFHASCGINSNFMFKTDNDFKYDSIPDVEEVNEYRISPNDQLQFRLFANDGFKIIDITSGADESPNRNNIFNRNNNLDYFVQEDSTVKLPILDEVKIAGLTVREAADTLESMYEEYYVDPFAQVIVTNKRVVIFPGNGGTAKVIYLTNNNTTLLEALALAGGITDRGRAKRVKLMRNVNGERKVYMVDLSTIDGLKYADMTVQANDYIYVDPVPQISRELLQEIAPIVSIISSAAVVISIVVSFQN